MKSRSRQGHRILSLCTVHVSASFEFVLRQTFTRVSPPADALGATLLMRHAPLATCPWACAFWALTHHGVPAASIPFQRRYFAAQVMQQMPGEVLEFLSAELSFFDAVTEISGALYSVPKDERKAGAVQLAREVRRRSCTYVLPG